MIHRTGKRAAHKSKEYSTQASETAEENRGERAESTEEHVIGKISKSKR
jgi:hypothetical protein